MFYTRFHEFAREKNPQQDTRFILRYDDDVFRVRYNNNNTIFVLISSILLSGLCIRRTCDSSTILYGFRVSERRRATIKQLTNLHRKWFRVI